MGMAVLDPAPRRHARQHREESQKLTATRQRARIQTRPCHIGRHNPAAEQPRGPLGHAVFIWEWLRAGNLFSKPGEDLSQKDCLI